MLDERNGQLSLPTMFIHGLTDELVPLERGKELMHGFSEADCLVHGGAHFVPTCTGQIKQSMVDFLERALESSSEQ